MTPKEKNPVVVTPPEENSPKRLVDYLPQRQKDALQLYVQGFSKREIAERMHISQNTARNHLGRAFHRLNISSELQAALLFFKPNGPLTGLLDILEFEKINVDSINKLSPKELEVLKTLTANSGKNDAGLLIAEALKKSEETTKNQFTSIYAKLGLSGLPNTRKRVVAGLMYLAYTGVIDKE